MSSRSSRRRRRHRRRSLRPSEIAPVVCESLGLDLSVRSGRGCRSPVWFPRSGVVCACWASGFPYSPKNDHGRRLFFASLGRSAAVFVRWMYPGPVALAGVRPLAGRYVIGAAARARRVISGALCAFVCVVTREPLPLAVRCVMFSVDRGVEWFSSRNWNHRFLWGFASEPASKHAS